MKKIFILLVGLFLSLGAEAFKDLPVVGNLDYSVDCGFQCKATQVLPKIDGKIWVDYIVFGQKGELTNQSISFNGINTAKTPEEADTIITVRPIAVDEKGRGGTLNNLFKDGKTTDTWKLVSTNMEKTTTGNGNGTSAGILTSGMSSSGMSNSASAGAGLALMFLSVNDPYGSFVYHIKITNKQGVVSDTYLLCRGQRTGAAAKNVADAIEDAIR